MSVLRSQHTTFVAPGVAPLLLPAPFSAKSLAVVQSNLVERENTMSWWPFKRNGGGDTSFASSPTGTVDIDKKHS